jgi:hypothetical protein
MHDVSEQYPQDPYAQHGVDRQRPDAEDADVDEFSRDRIGY